MRLMRFLATHARGGVYVASWRYDLFLCALQNVERDETTITTLDTWASCKLQANLSDRTVNSALHRLVFRTAKISAQIYSTV